MRLHPPVRMRAAIPMIATAGFCLLVAATAHASATVADADPPGVMLAPLTVEGSLPEHLRRGLQLRLRESLEGGAFALVDAGTAHVHIVRAHVIAHGTDLDLAIELVAHDGAKIIARVEDQCDMCGAAEAAELMASLGAALSRRVELALHEPPTLTVLSDPPGSTVILDGTAIGTTPLELHTTAGHHALRVARPGFVDQIRNLELVDGVRESVVVTLRRDVAAKRRPVRWALGLAMLGAGGASTIGGAALMGIDGRPIRRKCTGANVDADGTCRLTHSTMLPGAVIGTLGVGLLASGIALVVIEHRRKVHPGVRALLEWTPAWARAHALAGR